MSEVSGVSFQNGENCRGISFVSPDGTSELDIIDIHQEYPEGPFGEVWAKNERASMLATLISGAGRLAVRRVIDGEVKIEITELTTQTATSVPAGTWYAWQGDNLKSAAEFVPPFNPNYYKVAEEQDIYNFELLSQFVQDNLDVLDRVFFEDYTDFEDALGFVYGQLIEEGKDPDKILSEYGIIVKRETN